MQQLFRFRLVLSLGLLLAVFSGITFELSAQSLPLNFLFRPNAWVGYEYLGPAQLEKGSVALPSPYVGLTVPLYSSLTIRREPLVVKAHQIMGQFNARYQQVVFSGIQDSLHENGSLARQVTTNLVGSAGFVGVKASLNKGIWVYGIRTTMAFGKGAVGKPNYSILAGIARAQMKGLHKGYLYGLAFYASRDLRIPIPAFGYYYKPYKEVTFYAFIPVQMRLSYELNQHFNFSFASTISTRPAVVDIVTPTEKRPARFGSIGIRHGIIANIIPKKHTNIFIDAGYLIPQQISVADKENISYFAKPTWYVDFTVMRSFGHRWLDSPLGQF